MSTTDTNDQHEPEREAEPAPDSDATPTPPRRRWRKTRIGLLIGVIAVVALAFSLRTPSPVGHWDSAKGQDRFNKAYDAAFEDMPQIDETFDVRTDYGVVRLYRFSGEGETDEPLVLLPGRASASPVWADNMSSLLEIGDVYTIDLLGEPGQSVQQRPIQDDADQAKWLSQALKGLPEDKFHLIGLSIGGWTAANLTMRDAEQIASTTLIDPVYVFDSIPVGTAMRAIPAAVSWLPKSWRDGFNSYTAGGAPVEDVPVADMIEAGMQHYALKLPEPSKLDEKRLGKVDVPVFAIIAGESVMHDPPTAEKAAQESLSKDNVKIYPDASHAVNGEYPDEVATDIADFIAAN